MLSNNRYITNKIGIDLFPELSIQHSRMDTLFHNEEFHLGIECIDKSVKKNPFSVDNQGRLKSGNQLYSINKGHVKWDIILEAENKKTRIPFKVEKTKGIDFHPQPNGSIAVYCNKANHIIGRTNYKTGKLLHIGQLLLIDQKGNTALGNYEFTSYGFDMVLPDEFVKKSIGYIIVDPTFGYTTIGGSNTAVSSGSEARGIVYDNHTASTGDTVTGLYFYGSSDGDSNTGRMDLYTVDVGGTDLLDTRVGTIYDIVVSTGAAAWHNASPSLGLTNAVTYNCAYGCNGQTAAMNLYYDTLTGTNRTNNSAADLSSTWTSNSTSAAAYSMYTEYTAGGGGGDENSYYYMYNQ